MTEAAGAPTDPDPLDAVVLVGGTSERLGRDKAVVDVGGHRQVDRVVAALRPLGGRIVLAGGTRLRDVDATLVVADDPDLAGPLAGIVAGLRVARTPLVAIVAVDVVDPSATLLRALAIEAEQLGATGAVPVVDDRWQHLHAVVRRDLGPRLAGGGQRSTRAALAAQGVVGVPEATWRRWTPQARPDRDIDTAADLAAARRDHAG